MTEEDRFYIDNSKRSTFQKCPFRYDLTYNRGIYPVTGSTALRYGSGFHAGMEGFYSYIAEHGWTRDGNALQQAVGFAAKDWEENTETQLFYEDYRSWENLLSSLILYIEHFAGDEAFLKVLHTERVFRIRLFENIFFTGRLDMEMELSSSRWINEFKTTGRDITYLSKMQNRDPQFIGYTWAMKKLYQEPPEGILITYHHLSSYKSKKTGEYGQSKILFDRIPQFFTEQDLKDWEDSILFTAGEIKRCERWEWWPKQFDSCYVYGACPYLFLCEQKRIRGHEQLAEQYIIKAPWNVLDTVTEDKILSIE